MTRAKQHQPTTTIQVWPGGESYTYRGDLEGPEGRRSIRRRSFLCSACSVKTDVYPHCGHSAAFITETQTWRKGTPAEWAAIRREVLAERLQQEEVLCCDSGLVSDLLKVAYDSRGDLAEAFQDGEIRNLYADPSEWDAAQCREYIREYASVEDAHDTTDESDGTPALDALREQAREIAQDHPAEVFEWWRVSQWLCDELHAIGEVTIDNGYGCWWGRQGTGQQMIMDGTFQQVAERLLKQTEGD